MCWTDACVCVCVCWYTRARAFGPVVCVHVRVWTRSKQRLCSAERRERMRGKVFWCTAPTHANNLRQTRIHFIRARIRQPLSISLWRARALSLLLKLTVWKLTISEKKYLREHSNSSGSCRWKFTKFASSYVVARGNIFGGRRWSYVGSYDVV